MVKVGRRFFFDQTFQKKQKRTTIITTIGVVLAIIITFAITSRFHDNSSEKGKISYTVKQEYNVEIFTVMPSFLNYFEAIENVPLNSVAIEYDKDFTYDENGDNCTDEQIELIRKIRLGEAEAEKNTDPFACLRFVPNKLGSFQVKITVGKEENTMRLNIVDNHAPTFTAQDVTITNEEKYTAASFAASCEDNSKDDCSFDFYVPLRGEIVDYSKFTEPGTYSIQVVAKDKSGNTSEPKTVNLTILEVHYYTVTFNSNGGSSIESATVKEGEKIHSPYPQKDGSTFDGWYLGNKKFDFNTPITSDLTLTAKWKSNYTPSSGGGGSYSPSGGSSGSSSSSCQYGKYSDYTRSVSLYASVLHGKSTNDCAEKNNESDYNTLKSYVLNIANDLTRRDEGAIDLNAQKYFGINAHINHHIHTTQIVNSKGGLSGVLVEIDSESNGVTKTYTLYDCTVNSCKWR